MNYLADDSLYEATDRNTEDYKRGVASMRSWHDECLRKRVLGKDLYRKITLKEQISKESNRLSKAKYYERRREEKKRASAGGEE